MIQTSWLELLEATRPDYLERAREVAFKLLKNREYITIDDVRKECPPPDGIDPRVMGAVFTRKYFESVGYSKSIRRECHNRPIHRFRLKVAQPRIAVEFGDTH